MVVGDIVNISYQPSDITLYTYIYTCAPTARLVQVCDPNISVIGYGRSHEFLFLTLHHLVIHHHSSYLSHLFISAKHIDAN